MSMGGLEPPRISPHAPQTCTSTIPPHRHEILLTFQFIYTLVSLRRMLTQGQPSRKMILNHFPAAECHIDIFSIFEYYHKFYFFTILFCLISSIYLLKIILMQILQTNVYIDLCHLFCQINDSFQINLYWCLALLTYLFHILNIEF